MKLKKYLLVIIACGFCAGCVSAEVDKAFDGQFESYKETSVIVAYCQSCHVHRKFNPSAHLAEKPLKYKQEPHSSAGDCKTCHEIKRNIWNDIVMYTYFPDGSIMETE